MLDTEIQVCRFLLGYGERLVGDITEEKFCHQPVAGMNHPAWIIGHLAFVSDRHAAYVGGQQRLADWEPLFGKGSTLLPDPSGYPGREELLTAWREANELYLAAVQSATEEQLAAATQGPLAERLPTVRELLAFSLTGHVATHLGQLSAWRRADGRPSMY